MFPPGGLESTSSKTQVFLVIHSKASGRTDRNCDLNEKIMTKGLA